MYSTAALQFLSASTLSSWTARSSVLDKADFSAAVDAAAGMDRSEAYVAHLRSKYGAHFRIESIPRDPDVLERLGKSMSGDDVIISPVVLEKMIEDPDVAAYYERTIDHCFETVPQSKAHFAAMGLTFEPCGVVVHDDGTVTYICGGGDTPERVAQVNAINAARDAQRAKVRRLYIESSMEHAQQIREMFAQSAAAQSAQLGAMFAVRNDTLFSADVSSLTVSQPGAGPSSAV